MPGIDTLYLGQPGNLFALPYPRGGINAQFMRRSTTHALAGGGTRVQFQPGGVRQYELNYSSLDYASYQVLEEFYLGHRGPGPFVLYDPARRNLLTLNQSSASSNTGEVDTGIYQNAGQTITSSADYVRRGPRSLKMTITSNVGGLVSFKPPTSLWPGFPVIPGQPVCLSAWFYKTVDTGDPWKINGRLRWMNAAGATISDTDGAIATAPPLNGWVQISIAGTPPAGAIYVGPRFYSFAIGIEAGDTIYVDQPQFEFGTTPTLWAPGTGVPRVSFTELSDVAPWQGTGYRVKVDATLQEVTA